MIGPPENPATAQLLDTVYGQFLPNRVVVGSPTSAEAGGNAGASPHLSIPLLEGRGLVEGKPTAYVCQNYTCQLPVTDVEALAAQLAG